jgi:hypothetical protein
MSEPTQIQPMGNGHPDGGVARAVDGAAGIPSEVYAAIIDAAAARVTAPSPARSTSGEWVKAVFAAIPRHLVRTCMAAVPVALVNTVAFAGQLSFLRVHLPWPLAGQVVMAVALESIAVYLAFHAHVAQLANDSALRLRLAAYAFGAVIAAMNYSHYAAPGWRPTFAAVAVGLMSASSPWLWAVHSRRASRDALLAKGLIEPHAVRLGSTRWLWHPRRSARVMWHATWEGITNPAAAINAADTRKLPSVDLDAIDLSSLTARDRLAVAFGALGKVDIPAALALLQARDAAVDQSHAYQVRRQLLSGTEG